MRGRPATPIENLDLIDFDQLAKSPRCSAREKLRYLALAHIKDGHSQSEVAKMLRVCNRVVASWVEKFRIKEINGSKDQYCGGAQLRLPHEKYEEFRELVLALQANRKGGRIRGEDVRELLQNQYGIQCSLATVYNILKKAQLVRITGSSQHPKGDQEAQLHFKKTLKLKSRKQFQNMSP